MEQREKIIQVTNEELENLGSVNFQDEQICDVAS